MLLKLLKDFVKTLERVRKIRLFCLFFKWESNFSCFCLVKKRGIFTVPLLMDQKESREGLIMGLSRFVRAVSSAGFAALFLAFTANAQKQPELGESPGQRLIDEKAALKAAAQATLKAYPDADTVLVDDYEKVIYRTDGTSLHWDEWYEKILTEKGKRESQMMSLNYTLPYSKLSVPILEIFKADGSLVKIDVAANSREMVDNNQMGANIFNPNSKILQVSLPGLEIGDTLHIMVFTDNIKTRVPNTYSDYFVLEATKPIMNYRVEVVAPKDLPLASIALKAEIPGKVTHEKKEEGEKISYRWQAKDIPQIFEEPGMPPYYTVVQRLLVSSIPDWQYLSNWYWELSKPHLEKTTPGMQELVGKLSAEQKDRKELMRAIYQYVSQKIRYMGITTETNSPGYEPHDVSMTFENKYGVCRDKAALLVALLRMAGFNAYPVLIHNGPKKDVEVPQPFFNHAITAVQNDDGSYTLLDSTDESSAELFPSYLCNQSYLVAKPGGEKLLTSPIIPAEKNLVRVSTKGRITANGSLIAETQLLFQGVNDGQYRGHFSRMKPEERRLFFEARLKQLVPGACLESLSIAPENLEDISIPLSAKIRYSTDGVLMRGAHESVLKMPWIGPGFGLVNFILGQTGLEKRKYPLMTEIACGVQEEIELDTKGTLGAVLSLPAGTPLETPFLAWKKQFSDNGSTLSAEGEFLLKAVEFSPAEYLALKSSLKEIEYDRRKMPLFTTLPINEEKESLAKSADAGKNSSPDMEILREDSQIKVRDAHSWELQIFTQKKVLSYAGKKKNSEIKIEYNPVWEEVKIKGKVTTADGKVHELSPKELNLMDSPWSGSAPRYPAGKILVASLPAVDIGAIIETQITRIIKDRPFFAVMGIFQYSDPLMRKSITLSSPKDFALRIAPPQESPLSPGSLAPKEKTREDNGIIIREWSVDKQPALKPEGALPPWWSWTPCLIASSGEWSIYASELNSCLLRAASAQVKAAAQAVELTSNLSSPEAKIRAIRDYVAKAIRRAEPAFDDLPMSAITPADKTLSDAYGNNADQGVLLHAMLSACGFKPEFVLVSRMPSLAQVCKPLMDTPQPMLFKDLLVKLQLGDKLIYLNDTDQYAPLGASNFEKRTSLSMPKGELGIITIPQEFARKVVVAFDINLDKDGNALVTKTCTYYGTDFAQANRKFTEMPPEERRRYQQESMAEISQAAEAEGELFTDFKSYPGREILKVRVPRFAVRDAA